MAEIPLNLHKDELLGYDMDMRVKKYSTPRHRLPSSSEYQIWIRWDVAGRQWIGHTR